MIPIYHFSRSTGMPDLAPYGIRQDVEFLGHHRLFPRGPDGKPNASGWIDEDLVRGRLEGLAAGTPVFYNVEPADGGDAWNTFRRVGYDPVIRPEGVDLRLRLLNFGRAVNPNLRYGFYAQPSGWGGLVLNRPEVWRHYVQKLSPLLGEQDLGIPQFYFYEKPGHWPDGLANSLLWCERHFDALECYAPDTEIWPDIWPVWYDVWRRDRDKQHTPEHRDRCAMPGHVWRALLSYVLPRSDGLFIWDQGGAPWNDEADHWRVTLELIGG